MGRFYKTAKPVFVQDNIVEAPIDLMKEVLGTHDKAVDDAEQDIDAFSELLADVNNIKTDDPAVTAKLQEYRESSAALADGINNDIANYQQYLPQISAQRRQLQKDMSTGILGKAQDNFKEREKIHGQIDLSKKANAKRRQLAKKYIDTQYDEAGGLGFTDENTYNKYTDQGFSIQDDFDSAKYLNDLTTHFKENQSSYASAGPGGGYLWTKSGTNTYIDEKEVRAYMDRALGETGWLETAEQDAMLEGHNQGLRGQELEDYIEDKVAVDKENLTKAAELQLGFSKTTSKKGVTVDQKELTESGRLSKINEDGQVVRVQNRDTRNAKEKEEWSKVHEPVMLDMKEKLGQSVDEQITTFFEGSQEQKKKLRDVAAEKGIPWQAYKEAINNAVKSKDWSSIHANSTNTPDYNNKTELQKAQYDKAYRKNLVQNVKNYSDTEELDFVEISDENSNYTKLHLKDADGNALPMTVMNLAKNGYIPAGGGSMQLLNTTKDGVLLGKDNRPLRGANGEVFKKLEDLAEYNSELDEGEQFLAPVVQNVDTPPDPTKSLLDITENSLTQARTYKIKSNGMNQKKDIIKHKQAFFDTKSKKMVIFDIGYKNQDVKVLPKE